jgi:hypothetical protein
MYTIQSMMLYFLQYSPLVQVYTSESDIKSAGKISGSNFVKAFSALPQHSLGKGTDYETGS